MGLRDFIRQCLSRRPQEPVRKSEKEREEDEEEAEIEELVALDII
jgi:hypothetical protein